MDYKLNILSEEVRCEEELFPDIPQLLFGQLPDEALVFDATEYFSFENIEDGNWKSFSRANKKYITDISGYSGRETSQMFYQNKNNHILIVAELVMPFLCYFNSSMLQYFISIFFDLMKNGIAISDSKVFELAFERLDDAAINTILKYRNEADEKVEEQISKINKSVGI